MIMLQNIVPDEGYGDTSNEHDRGCFDGRHVHRLEGKCGHKAIIHQPDGSQLTLISSSMERWNVMPESILLEPIRHCGQVDTIANSSSVRQTVRQGKIATLIHCILYISSHGILITCLPCGIRLRASATMIVPRESIRIQRNFT